MDGCQNRGRHCEDVKEEITNLSSLMSSPSTIFFLMHLTANSPWSDFLTALYTTENPPLMKKMVTWRFRPRTKAR